MPRTVKTIKDDNGNDVEVYADNCNICNSEMIMQKSMADEVERIFPFIKQKLSGGSPCMECAIEQEKNGKQLFTQEEIEEIKKNLYNALV